MKLGLLTVGLALLGFGQATELATNTPIDYSDLCTGAKTKTVAFETFQKDYPNPCITGKTNKEQRKTCNHWVINHNSKQLDAYDAQKLCFKALNSHFELDEVVADLGNSVDLYGDAYKEK